MTKTHIERSPKCAGKKELLRHIDGHPLGRAAAMAAKCFECCNGFIDGRLDCRMTDCPLYPWMPYGKHGSKPDTDTDSLLAGELSEQS